MPKYVFKMPEESVWLALGAGLALIAAQALPEFTDWSTELIASISGFIPILFRFLYGMISPNPTVTEEIASVREALNDKPTE